MKGFVSGYPFQYACCVFGNQKEEDGEASVWFCMLFGDTVQKHFLRGWGNVICHNLPLLLFY